MGTKKAKRSIFPDKMPVFVDEKINILEEVENLASKTETARRHALSYDMENNSMNLQKNDISYLVKTGYNLPEVMPAEDMLVCGDNENKPNETENEKETPYRMINLISSNFKLPEIESEDFLK